MNTPTILQPPPLDCDAEILHMTGARLDATQMLERRIVANLCAHLESHGFSIAAVSDEESFSLCETPKDAMELIFSVDRALLYIHTKDGQRRYIDLVLGNGVDIISDYSYAYDDWDGFDAVMQAFDPEQFV